MNNLSADAEGYLLNPHVWTLQIAEQLAELEGITLTALHWAVVNFTRLFFLQHQTMPKMRELISHLRQNLDYHAVNSATLHKLFPCGPALQIAKIAGLPKPARCL